MQGWVRDRMSRVYGVKGISTHLKRERGVAREEDTTLEGHETKLNCLQR